MLDRLNNLRVIEALSKGLDGANLRHTVISNNLANAETPNFKRVQVSFENELKLALSGSNGLEGVITNKKHIPINSRPLEEVKPRLYNTREQSLRNDKNNVDVNIEMAEMSANTVQFNALITLLTRKISMLKMAMRNRSA